MATENSQVELQQKEITRLEKTLEAAISSQKETEKRLADMNEQAVKAKIETLTNDAADKQKKIDSLTTQVTAEQTARTEAEKKLAEAQAELKKVQEEVAKAKLETVKANRLSVIKEKLSLEGDAANDFYDTVAELSDEKFNKLVTATAKPKTDTTADNKNKDDAKDKAKDGNANNASASVLDNATPNKDAALNTNSSVNTNVQQTQASLADFMRNNYLNAGKKSNKAE